MSSIMARYGTDPAGDDPPSVRLNFVLLPKQVTELTDAEMYDVLHKSNAQVTLPKSRGSIEDYIHIGDDRNLRQALSDALPRPGKIPTRNKETDAGLDIYASGDAVIPKGSFAVVRTHLAWAAPAGWYGQIQARSGMSSKHGIFYMGGVVDAAYRQEWLIVLGNVGASDYSVRAGDRVAQVIIHQVPTVEIVTVNELPKSDREGGLGSSGR